MNKLEQNSVGKLMTELCLQTTCSIMLYNFYILTDTYFVSAGVGSVASGSIGIFSPVLLLINGISSTLGNGGVSLLSRTMGEGREKECRSVIGCVLWVWILGSLCISVVGIGAMDGLLKMLGCTNEIAPYASVYGKILLAGTLVSTGFSGIMRAGGDTTYSTVQWCAPALVNLCLDPLFIYGWHMGIAGAALATLCAQMVSACSSIYYFFIRKKTPYRIRIGDIRWNRAIFLQVADVGVPVFLNSLGVSLAATLGNGVLGKIGGSQAISIYTIISRIQSFLATPFSGIMQGIQPMIGYDLGRGRCERVKKTMRYALQAVILYGVGITGICIWKDEALIHRFVSDMDTGKMGVQAFAILSLSLLAGGVLPVVQAFLQVSGNGKKVFLLSILSIGGIRIPALWLVDVFGSLSGMWWILDCCEWIIAGISYGYYRKGKGEIYGKFDKIQTK